MPKQSGQDNKTVRAAPRPQPASRPIKRFDRPAPDPRKTAPAGGSGDPKIAADVKQSGSGSVDPKQQHY